MIPVRVGVAATIGIVAISQVPNKTTISWLRGFIDWPSRVWGDVVGMICFKQSATNRLVG